MHTQELQSKQKLLKFTFKMKDKRIKDKRKHQGAMDKRSSKQWFCKSDAVSFLCEKTGVLAIVESGLTAERQAGSPLGKRICCKVRKFKFCIFDF